MTAFNQPAPDAQPNPDVEPIPVNQPTPVEPSQPVDKARSVKPAQPVDRAPAVEPAKPVEKKRRAGKKPPVDPPDLSSEVFFSPSPIKKTSRRSSFERPFYINHAYHPIYGKARRPDFKTLKESGFVRPRRPDRGLFIRDATLILDNWNKNCYDFRKSESLFLPDKVLQTNMLVIGQMGGGKTQSIMYPMISEALAREDGSVVVLGSKGDEISRISAMSKQMCPHRRVIALNFSSARRSTVGWNPLATATDKNPESTALEVARVLVEADGICKGDSPFFRVAASELIASVIVALELETGKPARLVDVYRMTEDMSATSQLLNKAQSLNIPYLKETCSFLQSGNSNVQTVVVELRGAMRAFVDDDVATVTSCDDFRFETLFDEPTVLILEATQDATKLMQPIVNIFFNQLFNAVTAKAKVSPGAKLPRPLTVFLDDFAAAVGCIPDCAQRFNMMRSMDLRLVLAIQTVQQLGKYYSETEAASIVAACKTRVYVPAVDLSDAETASRESGTATFARRPQKGDKGKERTAIGFIVSDAACDSGNREAIPDEEAYPRALLLPDDVVHSPRHEAHGRAATVFLPETYPFQAWFPRAFERPDLARYFEDGILIQAEPQEGSALKAALDDPEWIKKLRGREPLKLFDDDRAKPKKSDGPDPEGTLKDKLLAKSKKDGKSSDKAKPSDGPEKDGKSNYHGFLLKRRLLRDEIRKSVSRPFEDVGDLF
ncbi:MAG: type IV secretory system conjugative DNA transfer family protein [Thermoguttaceae bacterium]